RPAPARLVSPRSPHPLDWHRAKSSRPRSGCPGTLEDGWRDRRGRLRMTLIHLAKLHATGNDFLVRHQTENDDAALRLPPGIVAQLCDRHLGIGADGLITIGPGDPTHGVDSTMTLQNADGGDA